MAINVLDPDVASKIAAGEVVERPSSVVKELVENSVDAGASQITVEVKGGGVELIRVTDNGCGIPVEEVETAFLRHATSKITGVPDLDAISTLGFRGEALPSIAAVARVYLVSRTHDATVGREVRLRWGELTDSSPKGCPAGTSVTVKGLFENVPARRKFLKSPSGERTRISDLVSRFALAYPEIQFRLLVEGKTSLSSPGNGVLSDALASVYGPDYAGAMLEVSFAGSGVGSGDGYRVEGFISSPPLNRANRSYITFLLNRRWIQSPFLSFALAESYQGFLPQKRHPMAVLNLTVPLSDVDVNVHPSKREVRFRQDDKVFSALQRAVRGALIAMSPVPEAGLPAGSPADESWQWHASHPSPTLAALAGDQRQPGLSLDLAPLEERPRPVDAIPSLRILGQAGSTYLVGEGPDGLYLIDQHAAHERVLFEKVSREVLEQTPQSQSFLEVETVEVSPSQEELLTSSMELLGRYGFIIEPFGERTYLVRGIPATVKDASPGKALQAVLDLMAYEGLLKERQEALAASIACHSAVRAGMSLTQMEMEELVLQLGACDSPHTCPHGRPTMVRLSSHHLEREFGRR